jgi:hypothetical protein
MGIYERIRKLYEKAEHEAVEERARQQRETELLCAGSRVAEALRAHGVKAADGPVRGWLIQRLDTAPYPPTPPLTPHKPGQGFVTLSGTTSRSTTVQYRQVEYHLGVDGRIYRDGKPIEHPENATIDTIEQYLAEIVVKNHLDPELFKDDDTRS